MERKLKERLAGAAILIMIAVIVIPVMLGDSLRRTPISDSNIPAKPETNFNPGMMPETLPYADIPLRISEPDNNENIQENPEKGVIKGMRTILENVSDYDEDDEVDAGQVAENESEDELPENQINDSMALSAWIIQLGSFTDEENAQALHKKLQKAGFSAFIESNKKNGQTNYRVRVGPEVERANADMLLRKIQDVMNINGFVVRYP